MEAFLGFVMVTVITGVICMNLYILFCLLTNRI
jgi:hypothetical protein